MKTPKFIRVSGLTYYVSYSELSESREKLDSFISVVKSLILKSKLYNDHLEYLGRKYDVEDPCIYYKQLSIDEILEVIIEKALYTIRINQLVGFISLDEIITEFMELLMLGKIKVYILEKWEKGRIMLSIKEESKYVRPNRIYGSNQFIFDYNQYIPLSMLEKINKLEEELNNGKSDT